MRLFATAFLLMHVQGNQKLLVCLEEKQSRLRTEQRKQLAHEVPDQFATNAIGTHRGRLYTERAWEAVTGAFALSARCAGTFQDNSSESTQLRLACAVELESGQIAATLMRRIVEHLLCYRGVDGPPY